jgi:hypothetical protein
VPVREGVMREAADWRTLNEIQALPLSDWSPTVAFYEK